MDFKQAVAELDKLAPDQYRAVQYEHVTYGNAAKGGTTICSLYTEHHSWVKAKTWDAAMARMRALVAPTTPEPVGNEAPKGTGPEEEL